MLARAGRQATRPIPALSGRHQFPRGLAPTRGVRLRWSDRSYSIAIQRVTVAVVRNLAERISFSSSQVHGAEALAELEHSGALVHGLTPSRSCRGGHKRHGSVLPGSCLGGAHRALGAPVLAVSTKSAGVVLPDQPRHPDREEVGLARVGESTEPTRPRYSPSRMPAYSNKPPPGLAQEGPAQVALVRLLDLGVGDQVVEEVGAADGVGYTAARRAHLESCAIYRGIFLTVPGAGVASRRAHVGRRAATYPGRGRMLCPSENEHSV
jgi:hypothetical protein